MTIAGARPVAPSGTYNHPRSVVPSASNSMSWRISGSSLALRDRGRARQRVERDLQILLRELGILKGPGQVGVIGGEVEVAVAAQAEEDRARLAGLLGRLGLLDHGADGVRGLGRGDDALGAGEAHG